MDKKTDLTDKAVEKVAEKKLVKVTVASEIWEDIKDKSIEMFALPNQKVFMYCEPKEIEPSKCYLHVKASSVLPALETVLGSKYNVERNMHFVVVSKKVAE